MAHVLLHACCGPCATYPVEHLRRQGLEVTAFWYNPNIHPFLEHQRRLEAMQSAAQAMALPLIISQGYDMVGYFRAVVGHEGERCGHCFRLRLSRTAEAAREGAFTSFTTTLLVSPYQRHDVLREVGQQVAGEQRVEFLYQDLRPGFEECRRMGQELDLYRQRYCGCVYSEWERFGKVDIARDLGSL